MTSETLGAVVQSTAFPSTDPTAIYCLFPSRLYILLCEMVNPQSVIISQTGYTYYIYIQLHNTYTFNTHTHNFPFTAILFPQPTKTSSTAKRQGANDENLTVRRGFLELMDTMPQVPNTGRLALTGAWVGKTMVLKITA